MCPVTPEILLTAKDQKQGKNPTHLNFIGSLLHLVSKTAPQTPAANDAQPCLHRAKSRALWEPLRFWKAVLGEGSKFFIGPHLHTQPTETLFSRLSSVLFCSTLPLVFLFTSLCFLLLAGPGSGSAEQQERDQPCCWLRSESLCSSDFTGAVQISVPKKIQILI